VSIAVSARGSGRAPARIAKFCWLASGNCAGGSKEKILAFLKADPDGTGSVQDQVTAEMTSELMKVMGIAGRQTAQGVKRIRGTIGKDPE
jgi:hypothetical protein